MSLCVVDKMVNTEGTINGDYRKYQYSISLQNQLQGMRVDVGKAHGITSGHGALSE